MKERLINLDYLRLTCGGSEEMVKMVIDMFVSTTPDLITELNFNVGIRNLSATARVAHKLKSSFLTIGAKQTSQKLELIELGAKSNKQIGMGELVKLVKLESDEIISELKTL